MAGENYIGSKISLISLSDIRYVGILHSINAQDSTVGLKQVRSFGTEGRRGKPEEEIPASDNVFDYVVFRGSDIKDLQVFEAPPKPTPPPQPAMPQDPAIMSMNGYPPPMNPYMNSGNMYMQPPPPTAPSSQLQQPQQQQQQQQATSSSAAAAMPSAPSAASVATAVGAQKYWQPSYNDELQRQQQKKAQLEKNTLDELKAELEETDALQPTINEAAIEQLAKKVSELNPSDDNVVGATNKADQSQQHQQGNRRRYDNNYRGGRGGRYIHNFTIPTSEFDFEASNAKFDKSEIVKKDHHHHEAEEEEEEEIEIPQSDEFYDKTSSFFDNISCESKERNEQRQVDEPRRSHFHEERKLNLETFGQATVDQSRYRNNYRGGRGGNNYRGGGHRGHRGGNNYRHHHNNRNNYNNNGFRQNKPQEQQQQQQQEAL